MKHLKKFNDNIHESKKSKPSIEGVDELILKFGLDEDAMPEYKVLRDFRVELLKYLGYQ